MQRADQPRDPRVRIRRAASSSPSHPSMPPGSPAPPPRSGRAAASPAHPCSAASAARCPSRSTPSSAASRRVVRLHPRQVRRPARSAPGFACVIQAPWRRHLPSAAVCHRRVCASSDTASQQQQHRRRRAARTRATRMPRLHRASSHLFHRRHRSISTSPRPRTSPSAHRARSPSADAHAAARRSRSRPAPLLIAHRRSSPCRSIASCLQQPSPAARPHQHRPSPTRPCRRVHSRRTGSRGHCALASDQHRRPLRMPRSSAPRPASRPSTHPAAQTPAESRRRSRSPTCSRRLPRACR